MSGYRVNAVKSEIDHTKLGAGTPSGGYTLQVGKDLYSGPAKTRIVVELNPVKVPADEASSFLLALRELGAQKGVRVDAIRKNGLLHGSAFSLKLKGPLVAVDEVKAWIAEKSPTSPFAKQEAKLG